VVSFLKKRKEDTMARPKTVLTKELIKMADRDLKKSKGGIIGVRLQAIISAYRHPVGTVASIIGTSPATIYNWILRYSKGGVEGLKNKPRGHYPSKLTKEQREIVFGWLKGGVSPEGEPIVWTIGKLKESIKEVFGVSLSHTPVWKMIRRMGFSLRRPRPRHRKADPRIQEDFKKKRKH